jgi:hypothetical protein
MRRSNRRARVSLFDHLVGTLLKLQGHVEAERLRGLEVDYHLELGWLLDRQVLRLTLKSLERRWHRHANGLPDQSATGGLRAD